MSKTKTLRVLAVDVGAKHTGWCYYDQAGNEKSSFLTTNYINFNSVMKRVMEEWTSDIIVVGKPNRYYNVVASHNRYIGILCLLAEKNKIPLIELNDKTARSTLFPSKGSDSKEEIQKLTGIQDPDQSDAFVLAKAVYLLNQNHK